MAGSGQVVTHAFVEFVPRLLEPGVLYVSLEYATASHSCFCGCGERVVTPLSPTDWRLIFDGRSVSLYPSIGSSSLACRSHYWIDQGTVVWARPTTRAEIETSRRFDRFLKYWYDRDRHAQLGGLAKGSLTGGSLDDPEDER